MLVAVKIVTRVRIHSEATCHPFLLFPCLAQFSCNLIDVYFVDFKLTSEQILTLILDLAQLPLLSSSFLFAQLVYSLLTINIQQKCFEI